MSRKIAGLVLFIGGGLTTSLAGTRYLSGALAQDRARREWDRAAAHTAVGIARGSAIRSGVRPAISDGAPVARLMIPKIGLDDIVLEGVDADALNGGPGHLPGSPLPGDRGNAIISGHRDRHFHGLGVLSIGDTLRTESDSRRATWVVVSKRVVDKDTPALFPSDIPTLTLTTCWPIEYIGAAPDRLIVTAKLAGQKKG